VTDKPVANNAIVASIMLIAGTTLAAHGIDQNGVSEAVGIIAGLVGILGAAWRFVVAHRKVTPLTNPHDANGTPLVPAAQPVPPS
jgi:hypothetical protein